MTVTLEAVQAKQVELNAMIEKLKSSSTRLLVLPETSIFLAHGERYVGPVLDAEGRLQHHLILMGETPSAKLNWQAAGEWAESVGGVLPTRQEQALLHANCKPHLEPTWHWSSEAHEEDASYAWYCYFDLGYQFYYHKSYEGCARAVRRV